MAQRVEIDCDHVRDAGLNALRLLGRKQDTPVLLTTDIAEQIRIHLPPLQKEAQKWTLLYSLDQHGISLETMFTKSATYGGPCVLVVQDTHKNVFGAYCSEELKRRKGYYGNGDGFLWKVMPTSQSIKVYHSTGANDYYILSEHGADIALGGGTGDFGLWLDDQLDHGYSAPCQTFANESLVTSSSGKRAFRTLGVELWGFQF